MLVYDQLDQQKDFVSDLTTKTEYRNDDHPNQLIHDKIAHIILNNINNKTDNFILISGTL